MSDRLPLIYFYLPQQDWPEDMPPDADSYWVGFRRGIYCWTLQTYLRLRADGFPCQLVGTLPDEGIAIAHWDSLPPDWQPTAKLLLVCIQADRARHPYAQIHIVQNPKGLVKDLMLLGDRLLLPGQDYYMPLWPQPGLIPREQSRGDLFENIAFFGLADNLLPELQASSWQERVKALGLNWVVVDDFERWNDYSNVDAILAVRSFTQKDFTWKPATKLYNAWHAGVPAILGCESAYQAERQSEFDYLEVSSLDDIVAALEHLRDDAEFRQIVGERGKIRAKETDSTCLTQQWKNLILHKFVPAYELWQYNRLYRQSFLKRRWLAVKTREMRKNLQKQRNNLGIRSRLRSLFSSLKKT
jgi:hypothetical protein